ncbi:hypothetical protein FACS189490_12180 [Clostridia bacterium]|nr:hypothetical protein FACS189490_12180 [Clostridia bacterium]
MEYYFHFIKAPYNIEVTRYRDDDMAAITSNGEYYGRWSVSKRTFVG